MEREECCNSGCNNCVLDQQTEQRQQPDFNKKNLFDGTYQAFRLIEICDCTENVKRYRFIFDSNETNEKDGEYTLYVPPTKHLIIRASTSIENANKNDKNTEGNFISRPYTPIVYDSNRLTFDILVKIEQHGQMSSYFNAMKLNDLSEWKGCYGGFDWQPQLSIKYLVCICQGVAIAPMFSLISSILSDDNDETIIYLIVCFKDLKNHLLRKEISEFRRFWNFNSIVYLSKEGDCSECKHANAANCLCLKQKLLFSENIQNCRLDQSGLQRFYSNLKSYLVFTLFCGTSRLKNIVSSAIANLNNDNFKKNFVCLE